ncbi:MAG: hypothetical protein WA709_17410 [Stellaceae bacterium]
MYNQLKIVVPGLDPGIHATPSSFSGRMDCRVKPGNDENTRGLRAGN